MAENKRTTPIIVNAKRCSDQELVLVEAYADPNSETFKQKSPSLRVAGYSATTIKSKGYQIFERPHVKNAINAFFIHKAHTADFGEDTIEAIKNLLKRTLDFDPLKLFETVTWIEEGPGGTQVTRRKLQVRDLVSAGIDGRLIDSLDVSESQKGQNIKFKTIPKLGAARLLAGMEGALDEGAGHGDKVNVFMYLGNPINPADVNNYLEFKAKYLPHLNAGAGEPSNG